MGAHEFISMLIGDDYGGARDGAVYLRADEVIVDLDCRESPLSRLREPRDAYLAAYE